MESYATAGQVYAAGLIFARVGAMFMLIPGIGEQAVPARARLVFALLFSLVLYPLLARGVPAIPPTVGGVAGAVGKEVLIGLMFGAILRLFLSSLATAGEIVSIQTTLAFAQTANPTQATPTPILGTFLGLLGVTLVMTTDLHHLFLAGVVRTYSLFPFSAPLPVEDSAQLAIRTVASSFALGLQLAAPVVVFSLVINIAIGVVGRVMPQFQVFFVATPLVLLAGLSIFAISLGVIGMVWVERYRDFINSFG